MKAYFDESGKHEQAEVLTMAGIVASKTSWKTLQNRWMKALHHLNLGAPFHASDCASARKNQKKKSQFDGMPQERREEIQTALIDTMKGLDIQCAVSSLLRKDYTKSIAAELRPTEGMRNPWYLAFEMAIGEMMARTRGSGNSHTLTFVFDRQDEFSKTAQKLYDEILTQTPRPSYCDRMGTLAFSPKDQVAPLQAIDLIVYETNLYVREGRLKGGEERWQDKRLREVIDINGTILDKAGLAELTRLVKADRGGE
jgi:hypothetical protein